MMNLENPFRPRGQWGLMLLFGVLLLFSVVHAEAQTVHLFVFTENDPRIGPVKDRSNLEELVDEVARTTQMEVRKYFFTKEDLPTAEAFREQLRNIACGPEDVAWFHYSGHGGNYDGWPRFALQHTEQTVPMTMVHEAMKRKGARLCLTTFDCCNTGGEIVRPRVLTARTGPAVATNYLRLFRQAKGDIKASSSKANQLSWSSPEIGGFFSLALIASLRSVAASNEPASWEKVLREAQKLTQATARNNNREQQPQFLVNVNERQEVDINNFPDEKMSDKVIEKLWE